MGSIGNGENDKNREERRRRGLSLLRAFFIGAAMALAWGILSNVLGLNRMFPSQAQEEMFARPLWMQIALYGLVSPLLEELLFRKFLYDLISRLVSWKIATVIVAALFALWHGNMIQMLYAFPAGLVLQEMRRRSGGMEEPVCCHAGANLISVLVEAILPGI